MRKSTCRREGLLLLFIVLAAKAPAAHWPQFRGPGGLGIAANAQPPVHFHPGSNLWWKAELPPGHSSPCVWGEHVFLTAQSGRTLETLCLDARSGSVRWRQAVSGASLEPAHRIANAAAPTPVTDGRSVFAYFGSLGLLAYDFDGRERWRRPLPPPVVEFGTSPSPILAGNRLILVCDQDMNSFLLAVSPDDGATLWRTERAEFRRSFATPLVWRHDGAAELVVPGSIWLRSYNLSNGTERWTYSGTSRVACSSPTAGDGLLFSASWNLGGDEGARITMPPFAEFAAAHDLNKDGKFSTAEIPAGPVRERFTQMDLDKDGVATREEWEGMADMFVRAGNSVLALRPGGRGDVTKTHLAWKSTRSLPYVSSPLYYRGRLFTVKSGGLMSCYEAKTGRVLYQDERLDAPGDYYSSAVAADGRVYLASQKGVVTVLEAGDTFRVLARNDLHEDVLATPALVGEVILLRTSGHLYAFRRPGSKLPSP